MTIGDNLLKKLNIFLSFFDLKISYEELSNNMIIVKDTFDVNKGFVLIHDDNMNGTANIDNNILKFNTRENSHKDGYCFDFEIRQLRKCNNRLVGNLEISTSKLNTDIVKGELFITSKNGKIIYFKFGSLANAFNMADYRKSEFANLYKDSFRYEKRNTKILNIYYEDNDISYDKNAKYINGSAIFGYVNDIDKERLYDEYLKIINTYGINYFELLKNIKSYVGMYKKGLIDNLVFYMDRKISSNFFDENSKDVMCYYLHK